MKFVGYAGQNGYFRPERRTFYLFIYCLDVVVFFLVHESGLIRLVDTKNEKVAPLL